jgi:putative ABC transport system permease protein
MDTFAQDLRYAVRHLVRVPGFTALALLTLALGIGANTAIFSVVHAVLWRPLRFSEPDRLVLLFRTMEGRMISSLSGPNFLDIRARSRSLSGAAGFFTGGNIGTLTLTGQGDPLVVTATRVTDGFFDVLRIPALHGRPFKPEENQPGQDRVVVLGYPLWRERFGGDPAIVGRSIMLDGSPYTVVGVAPHDVYLEFGQMWLPLVYDEEILRDRDSHWLKGIGRVAPGQTIDAAKREIETIGRQLAAEHRDNANMGLTTRPLHAHMVRNVRTTMLLLLGAAGFVLLIACANVANLVLVRAVHREGEMAIRAALGGSRARLLRQLLTESLVLAAAGGLFGLLLALWGSDFLVRMRPAEMLFFGPDFDAHIDPAVLLFTAALTLATGVTVGCLPAWQATRVDLARTMKRSERGARVNGVRGALVVSEMALAVLLLTGAGLLIRSFIHLQRVDPGLQPDHVLSFRLSLPDRAYDTGAERVVFFDQLMARLRAAPGVEDAAATTYAPMAGQEFATSFKVVGRPELKAGERQSMEVRVVTPDYFRTLAIPLRRGRVFTDADVEGATRVVLLSERAVHQYFPNEDPIGQHITIGWRGVNGEVVGVVGDIKDMGLSEPVRPQLYVPFAQAPHRNTMAVVIRAAVSPLSLANTVRHAVRAEDPNLAISDMETLDQVLAQSIAQSRFSMVLLATFGVTALLLAAIGIFGVLSNAVAHRTREIGIRLALGAQGSQVRGLVLRDALLVAGLGIVLGVVASLQLTKLMATLLFELAPSDPLTLAGVVIVLLAVALLASYLPARRASRVDPVIALRAE